MQQLASDNQCGCFGPLIPVATDQNKPKTIPLTLTPTPSNSFYSGVSHHNPSSNHLVLNCV